MNRGMKRGQTGYGKINMMVALEPIPNIGIVLMGVCNLHLN